ncbi:MAG: class I SAM-dependent methyltransferase [archaeon]
MAKKVSGEYAEKGDYHKKLDKKWIYYPVYVEKMRFVKQYLDKVRKGTKILDAGCGEGVLVEEYKKKGHDISGLDLNYSSKHVKKGDVTKMDFKDNTFNLILALDLIEHLDFAQQERFVKELKRVLKKGGKVLLAIPNQAHLASRLSFLFTGKLIRTSEVERHKGDRPIKEYLALFKKHGFKVISKKGIFPTYPGISVATYLFPSKVLKWHRFYNDWAAGPGWSFINLVELRK